jgi:hypothetical protein
MQGLWIRVDHFVVCVLTGNIGQNFANSSTGPAGVDDESISRPLAVY